MNKIYKVIWSKTKNCYVVASELAKSHTKSIKLGIINYTVIVGVLICVLSCSAVMPVNAQMYYGYNLGSASFNTNNNAFTYDMNGLMLFSSDFNDVLLASYPNVNMRQLSINKNGAIVSGNTGILSGGTVYSELRPISNGNYIATANTTGVNLSALDTQLKANTDAIANLSSSGSSSTPYVGINSSGGTNQTGEGAAGLDSIAIGKNSVASGSKAIAIGNNVISSGVIDSIAIGNNTNQLSKTHETYNSVGNYSIAIGDDAFTPGYASIAMGDNSVALGTRGIALGANSTATDDNVVSVGHSKNEMAESGSLWDSDYYRRIVNVANGVNDHDATTVGQLNSSIYSALHQNRVSLGNNSNSSDIGTDVISIGHNSNDLTFYGGTNTELGPYSIAIGVGAFSAKRNSVSLGNDAYTPYAYSVALGDHSVTSAENTISVGHLSTDLKYDGNAYGSDYFHRIVNVANGVNDHDVVTKGQMDTADTALSNRIDSVVGFLSNNGNYIKKSTTNNVAQNLTALDTQLKSVTDNLTHYVSFGRNNSSDANYSNDGAGGMYDIAVGVGAKSSYGENVVGGSAIAIGHNAVNSGYHGISIGTDSTTSYDSIAIGHSANKSGGDTRAVIAIGYDTNDLTLFGNQYTSLGRDGVAISSGALAVGTSSIALGNNALTPYNNSVAIGDSSTTHANNTVSFGHASTDLKYDGNVYGSDLYRRLTFVGDGTDNHDAATVGQMNTADTALSNRIGSLTTDGNYIKKAGTKNVSENLSLLDVQLKTTTDGLATEVTNRTNAVSSEATARTSADTALGTRIDNVTTAYQIADTGLSNRIGSVTSDGTFIKKSATNNVAANLTALDTATKNAIKGLSISGTTITYTKGDGTTGTITTQDNNTTYASMSTDELTAGTATTARSISAKVMSDFVVGKVNAEATTRSTADTALDNRIGTLSSNGNYIKKSATNNMAANLTLLDYQLKATNDNITGFASDITRNKNNIATLNTSVSSALSSVGAASSVIDLLSNTKADASLANLNASGKRVIANAAMNAVQEYMASQNGTVTPSAPMMYANNSNTLAVNDAGNGSLHVGEGSYVNGTSSIAIGVGNQVNANNSGAFGDPSIINADESYVLGNDDTINTGATGSFLIGNDSVSSAENGLSLGSNNKLEESAKNSIALGNNITVTGKNSVALGSGSTVTEDNTVSVGNATSKRKITNVMNGEISENSSEVVTGNQLFVTNEKVKANEDAIAKKADIDASNINVNDWTAKLGTGKVEEGNTGLITGGNVFTAIQTASSQNLVQTDGQAIHIGKNSDATVINVLNSAGENRVITGVKTDPSNPYSVANVGYVDAVNTNLANSMSQEFANMNDKMNKMGANAAAMASLTPASFEGDERWSLSAGVGNYRGETAGAVGAFYRPAENVLMNVRGSFGNNENMVGAAVSVSLSKGDVPGVTKRQLANTVNKQAEAINTLQQNQQKDQQLISDILQAREQDQQKLSEYEHKMTQQDKQIKELLKRLEAIEKR